MKEFLNKHWSNIISWIIGLGIGILINIPTCKKIEPKIEYIPVHDTIEIKKDSIIYKTKPVNVYFHDTLYVKESGDTVRLDSLPITEYKYQDTIKTDSTFTEISIEYHGFDAGIDNISFIHNYYNKQETIIQPPKRVGWVWFVGLAGGVNGHVDIPTKTVGWGPSVGFVAGVGIGGTIK